VTICQTPGCQEHYGCRLKAKGLQVAPTVGASTQTRNWRPTVDVPPPHYKNILTRDVPGGFKLPVLKADGSPIRHREAQRDSRKIDNQIARVEQACAQATKAR
jgi:hypothetical protein